ncbi:DUF3450 family protein [Haloferula chungangensis]|uniref:DUF3450 family protein n=1 Tax=Haloferula chungangensis TaxID=1048331 RepID=A0ABW2L996_9BACT
MRTWILWLAAALPVWAAEAEPDAQVVELRETISKIVDVKSQASEEKIDWETRKAEMSELLSLHRHELELLSEELEKAGTSAGGYDEKKREAEAELETLKAARRVASEAVVRNKDRMLALSKLFPQPLANETEVERTALEEWEPGDEARDGMQAILGMVTKAEQFNRRVTRSKEERDGRQVEVLYLGLSRAYYADRRGNAGVGEPAKDAWVWVSKPDISGEVVKAFDELDKKRPPEVVKLPVQIKEVGP